MNEKKFLDEINLRIGDAQEGYVQRVDRLDDSAARWRAKRDALENALESYMTFRDEPERFVSDTRSYIDWVNNNRGKALTQNRDGEANSWLAKWDALMNVLALYEECAAEPDDPPAPQEETFVGQLEADIELTNKRYKEALHYWNYHQAAALQVRLDTLKDILALYKRFAAMPQNHSAISK